MAIRVHIGAMGDGLLAEVRRVIRLRHYSRRTEQAYVRWVHRFVRFAGLRHPRDLGDREVTAFLTDLAVRGRVSAGTENQALAAGINPMHFAGATAVELDPVVMPAGSNCGDVWARHDWQQYDHISHESLAFAIRDAEKDIASEVGFWSAPVWLTEEIAEFPRDFYRTSLYQTRDVRGFRKAITTEWGRVIGGGRRRSR